MTTKTPPLSVNTELQSIIAEMRNWCRLDGSSAEQNVSDWSDRLESFARQQASAEPVALVVEIPTALPFRKVAWLKKDLPVGANLYSGPSATPTAAKVPDEWQPIETAPMDGTKVLITDGKIVESAIYWRNANKKHPRERWVWNGWPDSEPTHWMPLPAPPSAAMLDGKPKREAHSMSEYRRLSAQGVDVLPPRSKT